MLIEAAEMTVDLSYLLKKLNKFSFSESAAENESAEEAETEFWKEAEKELKV